LARTPSAPRFQPPASSSWVALSGSYCHRMFFERKRSGAVMKTPVAFPVRP